MRAARLLPGAVLDDPVRLSRGSHPSVAVAIVCAIALGCVVAVLGAGADASVLAACIVLACAALA